MGYEGVGMRPHDLGEFRFQVYLGMREVRFGGAHSLGGGSE